MTRRLTPRFRLIIFRVLRVDPVANERTQRRQVSAGDKLSILRNLIDRGVRHDLSLRKSQDVGCPAVQVIEDVRAVYNRRTAFLSLLPQEIQDSISREDVQIRRDLIHQIHRARRSKKLQELATPALPV